MIRRRRGGPTAAAIVLALLLVGPVSPRTAVAVDLHRTWLALGDSYSSGEGMPGVSTKPGYRGRDCERGDGTGPDADAKAWPLVAYEAVQKRGGQFSHLDFVACTGAITDDWEDQVAEAGGQTRESGGQPKQWDVISLSFGGNNLKFDQVLTECVDLDISPWIDLADRTRGCDTSKRQLRERIDMLAGTRAWNPREMGGSLALPEMYNGLAKLVRPGGEIVVAGYPQLVENPAFWEPWQFETGMCQGIYIWDAIMLRSVAAYLNEQIRLKVEEANDRWQQTGITFRFADLATEVYEAGPVTSTRRHGLCAALGKQWINGLTYGHSPGEQVGNRSFHPTRDGHEATGRYVVAEIVDPRLKVVPKRNNWQNSHGWEIKIGGVGPLLIGDPPKVALQEGVVRAQVPEGCYIPYPGTGILDRHRRPTGGIDTAWDSTDGSQDIRLQFLAVDSPAFRTVREGARVGMPMRKIRSLYGSRVALEQVLLDDGMGSALVLRDGPAYLVFVSNQPNAQGVVAKITVGRGSPAQAIWPC